MPQQAKQQAFVQRPVLTTTGTVHGLIDLFGGEQQAYAQLPVAGTGGITYGFSNLLPTDPHFTTASSSTGAWSIQNVTLATSEDLLNLNRLSLTNPFLSHTSNERTAVVSAGTTRRDLDFDQTASLTFAPVRNELIRTALYEGAIVFRGGTLSTQNSVTQFDETVEEVIWKALSILRIPERGKLAHRLLEIQKEIQEENEPICPGISISSLKSFLSFLKSNEDLRYPLMSASPEGNIYASWKREPGYVFSIHFLQEDNVRFVLFRPNEKHARQMIRISGSATTDVVLEIARAHGIRTWVYR